VEQVTIDDNKNILMADDDEEDCFLAAEAFLENGSKIVFSSVRDGIELMDYLLVGSGSEPGGRPNLILLDLNMPRKDGREALLEIRSNPALNKIPVVIFTTSQAKKDIEFCMKAGANSFISKPASFDEWIKIMKSLVSEWL
jgi:CheY-like chemotaxis protein